MTIKELSEYYKYSVKIKALDDEIKYLRGSVPGLCAKYGTGGSSKNGISDHTGNIAVHIAQKVSELEGLKTLCEIEREKISNFVLSVPDPLVSAAMYARFILCKSWFQVAMYVGGNNTADSCRMAVFRYCDSQKK